ncbi:MAG: lysophospholipid transporter LplT [Tepidimonas sp.]|uniref:lysophospholipid transporter LplT n=1 Tax=Tepidimonas sp. TaxID=2002775 RepID=UPI00298EDFEF|nr:lysophospholipid transporter LplT [Tepidimonas sp.]MDW8336184.1 lysophospholipid transporter LplT [Tepidimonas sp.]
MPAGFFWLLAAQFCSGLADHAVLIVAIAFLQEQQHPLWWAPLLKFAFTWSYVLLAPLAGAWADAVRKNVLMQRMNGLKALAVLLLVGGAHPLLAFALLGLAAALYAPAKYGWITESTPARQLVAANGWMEVSVVLSVLLGTALGGWWVSPTWQVPAALDGLGLRGILPATALLPAFAAVLTLYGLAAWCNRRIPARPVRRALPWRAWPGLWPRFWRDNLRLWRDPLGGLSLAVTTWFWGFGALMQIAVLRWAELRLALPLSQAAYLQATVALGVVAGAAWAARRVPLQQAWRVLPLGVLLGALLAVAVHTRELTLAVVGLLTLGALGGVLVVPMNALLQYRGHRLLQPGQSIAIQGFNENASVLLMLGALALALRADWPLVPLLSGLGVTMALGLALLWALTRRWRAARPTTARS